MASDNRHPGRGQGGGQGGGRYSNHGGLGVAENYQQHKPTTYTSKIAEIKNDVFEEGKAQHAAKYTESLKAALGYLCRLTEK